MSDLALQLVPQNNDADLIAESARSRRGGKIWIDLDNSPHVPFFAPIIEELEKRGLTITVTARDCFQVCGLANMFRLRYRIIGRHYGKHRILKIAGLCWRSLQLLPAVIRDRPALAISHGSRSQLVVASLLRIPSVTIADYEFTKLWMFTRPTWVMTPEVIEHRALDISRNQVLKYPGIKEDVYVSRLNPQPGVLDTLGVNDSDVVVLLRPPASEAHYHCKETDELFKGVLTFLGAKSGIKIVVLPRNEHQAQEIRSKWNSLITEKKIVIPDQVLDGVNLIWHADLMISGGGTMNREAAALGVPVYSIFRGKIGAVDRYLASAGRLILIDDLESIANKVRLEKRKQSPLAQDRCSTTLHTIVGHITTILARADRNK